MDTQDALTRYFKYLKDAGRSPATIRAMDYRLRHLAREYPELPLDNDTIEAFLRKRKETPARRGMVFKCVQGFYSFLEREEGIPSPVPSRGPVGRPRKRSRSSSSPRATAELITTVQPHKSVQGGRFVSASTYISTQQAVDAFLRSREVNHCSPKTLRDYGYFFRPFIAKFPYVPLSYTKLEEFLDNPRWGKVALYDARKNLIAFYHFLEQRKMLPKDLVEFPPNRQPKTQPRVLSREEILQLWPFIRTHLERCILATLLDTKCRAGELCSMAIEKIWPDHALVEGKTGEREVPLSAETYALLRATVDSGPIFTAEGKVLTKDGVYHRIHDLMERAGLSGKKLGPHILRHSTSVQHILMGGSERLLQHELGHTTPIMTAHYSRLANVQVRKGHQDLNVLGGLMPAAQPATSGAQEDEKISSQPRPGGLIKTLSLDDYMKKIKGG